MFARAADIRREVAALARPPVRMAVSAAARKYVKVQSGGGVASWDPTLTPYMIEPMDLMASRQYESVIYAGPARTGKTQALIDCFVGYEITCDPSDTAIVQISQEKSKDFSKLRINRMHRNSPEIGKHTSSNKQDDNVHEKYYRAGNVLKIIWPTVKQLSSSEFKYMLLTDYDRMPQNVDKEGSPFALGQKRTQTFLSRGMTMAESSPGFEISDPKWQARSPHEAPPTKGILSLYNLGDRRRWYMKCPCCDEYFLPPAGIEAFSFNINKDLFGETDTQLTGENGLVCTECGEILKEESKHAMNASGIWVQEGCNIEREGKTYGLAGTPRETKIASFWQTGASAAYQKWESIIQRYLNALREYDLTGSEESLKTTTNVDQGCAYLPRRLVSEIESSQLEKRAEDLPKREVPEGVRYLLATFDTQGTKFVVQIMGFGIGDESWLIDRFDIHISKRTRDEEALPLDPSAYIEDWDLIVEKVMQRSYPLADGSGRTMSVYRTGGDAYGKKGVTDKAYDFYRKLKKTRLSERCFLLKGERPNPNARKPLVQKVFPDNTNRKDRRTNARGEVPVWIINTTRTKDAVMANIKRDEHGAGYMHYTNWLGLSFYEELLAETRSEKGWENLQRQRNEKFDLYQYAKGLIHCILVELRIKEIDWEKPPVWAAEWDNNSQINLDIKATTQVKKKKAQQKQQQQQQSFIQTEGNWFK